MKARISVTLVILIMTALLVGGCGEDSAYVGEWSTKGLDEPFVVTVKNNGSGGVTYEGNSYDFTWYEEKDHAFFIDEDKRYTLTLNKDANVMTFSFDKDKKLILYKKNPNQGSGTKTAGTSDSLAVRSFSYGKPGVADVELRPNYTGTASGSDFQGSFDFTWSEGENGRIMVDSCPEGSYKPDYFELSANGKCLKAEWPGTYEYMYKVEK